MGKDCRKFNLDSHLDEPQTLTTPRNPTSLSKIGKGMEAIPFPILAVKTIFEFLLFDVSITRLLTSSSSNGVNEMSQSIINTSSSVRGYVRIDSILGASLN